MKTPTLHIRMGTSTVQSALVHRSEPSYPNLIRWPSQLLICDHVIQVENALPLSICEQYKYDEIVCPPQLRKGLFTKGALDNLDHNPSSTTSPGSFHGTSIIIIQQPTQEQPGTLCNYASFFEDKHTHKPQLPDSYAIVPAVDMKPSTITIPEVATNIAPHICR